MYVFTITVEVAELLPQQHSTWIRQLSQSRGSRDRQGALSTQCTGVASDFRSRARDWMPHRTPSVEEIKRELRILQLCPSVGVRLNTQTHAIGLVQSGKLGILSSFHLTLNSRGENHVNRSTHHLLEPVIRRYRTLGRIGRLSRRLVRLFCTIPLLRWRLWSLSCLCSPFAISNPPSPPAWESGLRVALCCPVLEEG